MKPHATLVFILSATLFLWWGCGGVQLRERQVDTATLSLDAPGPLCPGASAPLIVNATLVGGEVLVSEGAGRGEVSMKSFQFHTSAGQISPKGVLTLDASPEQLLASPITITAEVIGHPKVVAQTTASASFACAFVADFRGQDGPSGQPGQPGASGVDGKDEQTSPSYAKPGGHGQAGGQGGPGGPGAHGAGAADVKVSLGTVAHPETGAKLLDVTIQSDRGQSGRWIVDPNGGSLTIVVTGGRGGSGGPGGPGGRGGGGGTGVPAGNGGDGGDGGAGGNGGNGGDGGHITLSIHPDAKPLQDLVRFENIAGNGGSGGNGGASGSGGTVFSGATQGRSGRAGSRGQDGHPGRNGQIHVE